MENMGGFCGRAFAVCVHDHSHVRPQAQRHTGRDRDGHASAHEYGGHAGGQQLAGRVPHQLSVRLSAAASASGFFHSGGEPAGRALGGHGQHGLSAGLAQHPGAGGAHPGAGAHCGRYAAYRLLYGAGRGLRRRDVSRRAGCPRLSRGERRAAVPASGAGRVLLFRLLPVQREPPFRGAGRGRSRAVFPHPHAGQHGRPAGKIEIRHRVHPV